MSRLTYKNKRGYFEACGDRTGLSVGYDGSNAVVDGDVVDRLAAYEDMGLEPEEIKDHEEMFAAYRHVCGGKSPEEIVHALELMEAERNGRLVVLPCKVGDAVYMVSAVGCGDNVYHCDKPCNGTWKNCNSYDESLRIDEIPFSYFRIPDIGKTVFPTRAEAEEAMKGGQDE